MGEVSSQGFEAFTVGDWIEKLQGVPSDLPVVSTWESHWDVVVEICEDERNGIPCVVVVCDYGDASREAMDWFNAKAKGWGK